MKRVVVPLSLLAVVGMLWGSARPAQACSPESDYDIVKDAEVLVAGRLTSFEILRELKFAVALQDGRRIVEPERDVPFSVHMEVDHVFKGDAPQNLEIVADSLDVYDHEPRHIWTGADGACGAFSFDPTDKYVIVSLWEKADRTYVTWIFGWLFVGDEPAGEYYELALEKLDSVSSFPYLPAAVAATLGPLAFLAGAAFVWRRSAPHTG